MAAKARVQKRLYYKIGEACKALGIQPYVLRYWETEFPALSPSKSRSGQRVYSEKELEIIRRIKQLLYDEGYTIAGAKKKLEGELATGTLGEPASAAPASVIAAPANSQPTPPLPLPPPSPGSPSVASLATAAPSAALPASPTSAPPSVLGPRADPARPGPAVEERAAAPPPSPGLVLPVGEVPAAGASGAPELRTRASATPDMPPSSARPTSPAAAGSPPAPAVPPPPAAVPEPSANAAVPAPSSGDSPRRREPGAIRTAASPEVVRAPGAAVGTVAAVPASAPIVAHAEIAGQQRPAASAPPLLPLEPPQPPAPRPAVLPPAPAVEPGGAEFHASLPVLAQPSAVTPAPLPQRGHALDTDAAKQIETLRKGILKALQEAREILALLDSRSPR